MKLAGLPIAVFALLFASGCSRPLPENALVITQVPSNAQTVAATNFTDAKYPRGSRVVIASGIDYKDIRVLSASLAAAGEPVVSYDGHRIVFAGKSSPESDWQIYEGDPSGGRSKALTAVKGGATDPALLADGTLLYVSPAQTVSTDKTTVGTPSLFAQASGHVRQLTFGLGVSDTTVLADGRILFVSTGGHKSPCGSALYTINNDGTELTAYAGQHDSPAWLRRPRDLGDGRIVFLAGNDLRFSQTQAEFVLSARPFTSRGRLLPEFDGRVFSVQLAGNGDWVICAQADSAKMNAPLRPAVFLVKPSAPVLESPVISDTVWASIEAVPTAPGRPPMGRLSNVDLSHSTGQILCLNANDFAFGREDQIDGGPAKRIRVLTKNSAGGEQLLGEVELQPDGSFMAEVPADTPLGFEAVDEKGTVLRREPPLVWVRPGENRSCIGCHEAHNHSPHNVRPLAVRVPVPRLGPAPAKLAKNS